MQSGVRRANHYPLKTLCRSVYQAAPGLMAQFSGHQIFTCAQPGSTTVYHAEDLRLTDRFLIHRERLSDGDVPTAICAYHKFVGFLLRSSGLVKVAGRTSEFVYPDWYEDIPANRRSPSESLIHLPRIRGQYRWTWDIERHSGRYWLVPVLGLRFVSAATLDDPPFSAWAARELVGDKITGLNLVSGALETLLVEDGRWVTLRGIKHAPIGPGPWHITFNPHDLKRVHRSEAATGQAQARVHSLLNDVSQYPFAKLLESFHPLPLAKEQTCFITGSHLKFGRKTSAKLKGVFSQGLYQQPPKPVRLLFCVPSSSLRILRDHLLYHFWRQSAERKQGIHLQSNADTAGMVWNEKWRLPPFSFHKPVLKYDDDGNISNSEVIQRAAMDARAAEQTPVNVVILPDQEMPPSFMERLHAQFKGTAPVVQFRANSLLATGMSDSECFSIWGSLALKIAVRAGAVPWILNQVPGVEEGSLFIGIDLGHNHRLRKSRLSITAVDHRGLLLIRKPHVFELPLNERLPDASWLDRELRTVIRKSGITTPSHVIVHRDGRFVAGELGDLRQALSHISRISFVAVKKDSLTRLDNPVEGMYWRLDSRRAFVLTNVQNRAAAPLEIEIHEPAHLSLDEAAAQVFWLTRAYQGDAFQVPRLPITTRWADSTAGTGKAFHLSRWAMGGR